MAEAMEGIMGLPNNAPAGEQKVQIDPSTINPDIHAYAQRDPMAFRQDMLSGLEQADPQLVAQFKARLAALQLPPEVIEALTQMVDVVMANVDRYAEVRADFVAEDPELFGMLLPEEFDPAYFSAFAMALDQMAGQVVQPQAFADGGLASLPMKPLAQAMRAQGRAEDSVLAHITPYEARILRSIGGSGTTNPVTGLPEFGFFSGIAKAVKGVVKGAVNVVKSAVDVVKDVVKSDIGKVLLTAAGVYFLGPMAASYFNVSASVGAGIASFGVNTAMGLVSGQSLGDALKSGAIAGVTAWAGSELMQQFGPQPVEAGTPGAPDVVNESVLAGTEGAVPAPGSTAAPLSGSSSLADMTVSTPLKELGTAGVSVDPVTGAVTSPVSTGYDISGTQYSLGAPGSAPFSTAPAPAPVTTPAPVAAPTTAAPDYLGGAQFASQNIPAPAAVAPPAYNMPANVAVGFDEASMLPINQYGETFGGGISTLPTAPVTPPAPSSYSDLWSQGDYMGMAEKAGGDVLNFLDPRVDQNAIDLRADELVKKGMTYKDALAQATKEAPGVISRYTPLALTGLGVAGALGGFTPDQPEIPEGFEGPTGVELLALDPTKYGVNVPRPTTTYATNPYAAPRQYYDYRSAIAYRPGYTPARPFYAAEGGIASLQNGGSPNFPRKNGHISGPGGPRDDKIPAMLSDGEFVFTAKAVRNMGNGSRRKGAKKMYALMKKLENGGAA